MAKQKETTTDVVVKPEETAITTNDQNAELLAQLRQGSGEGEGRQFPKPAEIRVDNESTPTDIQGRMVEVLNPPMWCEKVENRNEYGELIMDANGRPEWRWEKLTEELNAVVLKTQYMIKKKYVKNDTEPYFYSRPFNSCASFDNIDLFCNKEVVASMPYAELKVSEGYGGKYDLWMIIYYVSLKTKDLFALRCSITSRNLSHLIVLRPIGLNLKR